MIFFYSMIKIHRRIYSISTKTAKFLDYLFRLFFCHSN